MSLPTEQSRPSVRAIETLTGNKRLNVDAIRRTPIYPKQWTTPISQLRRRRPPVSEGYELSESYSSVRSSGITEQIQNTREFGDNRVRNIINPSSYQTGTREDSFTEDRVRRPSNGNERQPLRSRYATRAGGGSYSSIDRAPLLGADAGIGGGAITAAAGSTSSTLIPAAIGGVVGGLALGNILASGVTLPGTDYVGPGNKIHIDAPRSEVDAIAKDHDVAYDRAPHISATAHPDYKKQELERFKQHIANADAEAIEKFTKHWEKDKNWQAFVAKYGLEAKQWIESVIGHPLYPQPQGKCLDLKNLIYLLINVVIGIS